MRSQWFLVMIISSQDCRPLWECSGESTLLTQQGGYVRRSKFGKELSKRFLKEASGKLLLMEMRDKWCAAALVFFWPPFAERLLANALLSMPSTIVF